MNYKTHTIIIIINNNNINIRNDNWGKKLKSSLTQHNHNNQVLYREILVEVRACIK